MKRIGLYLDFSPGDGGTFQYCQSLIDAVAALPPERFSVVFAHTAETWLPYLPERGRRLYVAPGFWGRALSLAWTRLRLPIAPWRRICPLFHPIARALVGQECDLWIFPSPTAKSFQFPVPALVSIHDLMHRYERRFPESASGQEFLNRELNFTMICRWARGVLVDSECGRQQVHESYGMPYDRIHPLPYVAPAYIRAEATPAGFDERYRLPGKFLFYPAQFWAHKNHRGLVEALRILKGELPDLKLVCSGTPKNAYQELIDAIRGAHLDQDILFLGYVPDQDMPELYRRARAMVMPTFYGPTNIPPLEAFTVGCPAAVSKIYAMPDQVGDAALLFDPHSVDQIADCIRRLWTDDALCAELAARGKQRVAAWGQEQFNQRLRTIVEGMVSDLPRAAS